MAQDMNRVTLVGRLTRDPETRGKDDSILSMRLAVSSRQRVGDAWEDKSNYFDVTVFGAQVTSLSRNLSKGRRIGVDGRLSWREWESDGGKRQSVEVIANDVFYLDSKADDGAAPKRTDDLGGELPGDWGSVPSKPVADDSIPF